MSRFRLPSLVVIVTVAASAAACKDKSPAPAPESTPTSATAPMSAAASAAASAEMTAEASKEFVTPLGSCLAYPAQHMCTEFFHAPDKKTCQNMHTWVEGGRCKQDEKLLGTCEVVSDMGALHSASKKVYYELEGDAEGLDAALAHVRSDCKSQTDDLFPVASRTWKDGPASKAKAGAAKGAAPKH